MDSRNAACERSLNSIQQPSGRCPNRQKSRWPDCICDDDSFAGISLKSCPLSADFLDRLNPLTSAIRPIIAARTLKLAGVRCQQFVWAKTVFLHVRFTVNTVLGEVPATYYAAVIAADPAPDVINAIQADDPLRLCGVLFNGLFTLHVRSRCSA